MTSQLDSEQRQAFFLLKEIMETVLICETEQHQQFHIEKLERLRLELNTALQNEFSVSIEFLQDAWEESFFLSKEQIEKEFGVHIKFVDLSWQQIFDTTY